MIGSHYYKFTLERTIRSFTIGRKNWLFSASTKGAEASGAIYSIVETSKANHLDPYGYIEFLLDYMPSTDFINNEETLNDFLPWSDNVKEEFNKK